MINKILLSKSTYKFLIIQLFRCHIYYRNDNIKFFYVPCQKRQSACSPWWEACACGKIAPVGVGRLFVLIGQTDNHA